MIYYDELIKNIQDLIASREYDEAKRLINNELKMPYVPKDTEGRLKDLLAMCPFDSRYKGLNDEEIEEYLNSNPEKQLRAIQELDSKNLRDYIDISNKYLSGDGFINAKVLLIESLIRQEISAEINYKNNGTDYTFIPRYIMLPEESEGYQVALKKLEDLFMKEPSMFIMAKSLVYKECLMALPISFVEEEGEQLALKIYKYVKDVFD